jgi:hypothetical protein
MTIFEYLAIAFSLVFSFTAMRLLAGLPYAARTNRRYWIHLYFVCGHLLTTLGVFWNFLSYRDVTWTFGRFVLTLAIPALLFFNACTLVPENASAVESWRNHYYAVRRRYFIGVGAWALAIIGSATVVLEMPPSHPARLVQIAWFLVGFAGAVFSSERVHAAIVVSTFVIGLGFIFTIAMLPGSLAP